MLCVVARRASSSRRVEPASLICCEDAVEDVQAVNSRLPVRDQVEVHVQVQVQVEDQVQVQVQVQVQARDYALKWDPTNSRAREY